MKLSTKNRAGAGSGACKECGGGGGSGILKVVSWSRRSLPPESGCGGVKAFDVAFADGRAGVLNIDAFAFASSAPVEWCLAKVGGESAGPGRLLLPSALRREIEPVLVGPALRFLLVRLPYSGLKRLIADAEAALMAGDGEGEGVRGLVAEASHAAADAGALLTGLPHGPYAGVRQVLCEDLAGLEEDMRRLIAALKRLGAEPGLPSHLRVCAAYAEEAGVYALRLANIRQTLAEAARGLRVRVGRSR